jgi:hypothetical protein
VFVGFLLIGLDNRYDMPYLRNLGGVILVLVAWEGFIKSLVLGWLLLPVALIQGHRARKRKVPESLSNEAMTKMWAEALTETLEKDPGNRQQLREIIDKLDEYNTDYYA